MVDDVLVSPAGCLSVFPACGAHCLSHRAVSRSPSAQPALSAGFCAALALPLEKRPTSSTLCLLFSDLIPFSSCINSVWDIAGIRGVG